MAVVGDVALVVALADKVVVPAGTEETEAFFLRDTASINQISINHKAHIEGVSS